MILALGRHAHERLPEPGHQLGTVSTATRGRNGGKIRLDMAAAEVGLNGRPGVPMRGRIWLLGALAAVGALLLLAASPVAYAHGGIDAGQNPITAWNVNPLPTLLLLLAANLYLTGLSRWERPSHPVKMWQKVSFFAGLLFLFVALQSPLEALAEHMFSFHQIQHLLLRMFGPLLILLGAPLTPMLRGLPPWALHRVVRPIVGNPGARRAYEILTNPVFTTVLFLGVLYLWQVPAAHNAALRNAALHEFMHFTMLASGLLFWWLVVDPKPHRSRLHYGLRILYLGLIVIPNTMLGAGITFSDHVIYNAYSEVEQPFNMSLQTDQEIGGAILWVLGDMMSVIVAGAVMIMWFQREEAKEPQDAASP